MGGTDSDDRAAQRAKGLVGRILDERYQIDRVLAMGGMGSVYLARHLKLKKRVALKVLHPDTEDHPELFLRFDREALAGAQVNHPNVASATDFGELEDGTRFLVMEYVRGTNLRSVIDSDAPLAPVRAARVARQIAVALGEIHGKGIVHRDIKPRNVMLGEGDFVKIVDFGLAKVDGARVSTMSVDDADEGNRLTDVGSIFGTVEYLAPEAALGMELVDGRADLYALGVMLYEMLTGKHPFDAANDVNLFAKQRTKPPPPFAERAPSISVPAELEAITMKLLEKDFALRYQTAAELVAALDAAAPDARAAPIEAPVSSTMSSRPAPPLPASGGADQNAPEPPTRPAERSSQRRKHRGVSRLDANRRTTNDALESTSTKRSRQLAAKQRAPEAAEPPPKKLASEAGPAAPAAGRVKTAIAILAIGAAVLLALYAASQSNEAATARSTSTATASASLAPRSATATSTSTSTSTSDAVPSSSASEATATVTPPPGKETPIDPAAITAIASQLKDGKLDAASEAATALLRGQPDLIGDKLAAATIRRLLVALSQKQHARMHDVYRAVGTTQGSAGPDLLYKLIETSGKAAWATEAASTLRDPEVAGHTSAALDVAFKLRFAPCNEKLALIDRAAENGDERAAIVLDIQARGCLKDAKRVDAALEALRKRLAEKRK